MDKLEQDIRDYYGSQSLSDSKIDEILENGKMVDCRPRILRGNFLWAAACLSILVGGVAIRAGLQPSLEESVANEVFYNHSKGLEPEVKAPDFERIQKRLTKLTFPISPSESGRLDGFRVLGGRYCSIRSQLAAQIDLRDDREGACTLYIAELVADLKRVNPGIYQLDGGTVEIWQDGGRIFALAKDL